MICLERLIIITQTALKKKEKFDKEGQQRKA
jgi:hypothetical protein